MTTRPLVSLIAVNYNGAHTLPGFLEALAQTRYDPFELLVVDNASSDGSVALLESSGTSLRLIRSPENVGFGCACNRGAAESDGDYLVFLNPDVRVTPDWLSILVATLERDERAAIVSPQTLPGYRTQPSGGPPEELHAVPGCAMMVRRAAWEELGGFDERIFLYWEDTELCWRAWLSGWSVLADRRAYVFHDEGGSSDAGSMAGEQLKNGLYTNLKLMPWRNVLAFVGLAAVKSAIRFARQPQRSIPAAWTWNLANLPSTLAARRAVPPSWQAGRRSLARRVDSYRRRGRRELVEHRLRRRRRERG